MIRKYHRPSSLEGALDLLARGDVVTVLLGGGTVLNGLPAAPADEVVDLQGLALDGISSEGTTVTYGAMARLQDVVDNGWTPPLLRHLARGELPSTLRTAASVGGTVAAADGESRFLAGLLACEATVTVATRSGDDTYALDRILVDRTLLEGAIIRSVTVETSGFGAWEGTGRTPADTPIVLVAGRRRPDGGTVLAATGVAATPVVIDPDHIDDLDPPGDFRGTPEYRRHLAAVLANRVISRLEKEGRA